MSFRLLQRFVFLLTALLLSHGEVSSQTRARRNFYGMHNLKDGGAPIPEGMNWTRRLVGEGGYVFDWVRGDYGRWVVDAMDRGLIPCLRIQNCNGGCDPDPGHAETVANVIRQHLAQYRPQYLDRLIYLQLWNEPGDPRDFVTPERFADYLVQAHAGVKRADARGVFRTMTPGQNGPDWWRRAIRHNPAVCQAFDVWATHPYPESYPPHYNHHDGVPFINQVKTIDSYLLDLDAVAMECEAQGSPRRGFPVMITETIYGDRLGISYEGYPKTSRGPACSTDGPCEFKLASQYTVAAFTEFWHKWPEIIAVHPFILQNWSWDAFAFVSRGSGSRSDKSVPSWCPPEDISAGTPFPPGYSTGARRCGLPTAPYPQYKAVFDLTKPPPASLTPFRGPVGTLRGKVTRKDTGAPVRFATASTDGYEFGGPTLSDGIYVVRNVPAGAYQLKVEKVGYAPATKTVTVSAGVETVVDFPLAFEGKVSKGIYFRNQGTCNGCNLFAPFLGQTFRVPDDVGFIKFVAAMPNVGNVVMKFTILEGGPAGAPAGPSVTAFLEWGGEMIGAEFPGDGVPVEPGQVYFLKVERADGQGVYLYATDSNPYPDGMVFTGTTPHPIWDLFATIRGNTVAASDTFGLLTGRVEDDANSPLAGAQVVASPGGSTTATTSSGDYSLSLREGAYDVTASLDGFSPAAETGVAVLRGQTTVVNLTLPRDTSRGRIEGTVEDASGIGISGASIQSGTTTVTSDGSGRFALESLAPGAYTLVVSKSGFVTQEVANVLVKGGETTTARVVLQAAPAPTSLVANGDFARGLESWSLWTERGSWSPTVVGGKLQLSAVGHNGGVYQKFQTGGAGTKIDVDGFWETAPTAASAQWAEVLVINGPRNPTNGQDLSPAQSDVVLIYKNDTWASPQGWSGAMADTAKVQNTRSFVAASSVATLVLKSGNLLGVDSGTRFDDVVVRAAAAPANRPPVAQIQASPTSGAAPLQVSFDGSGSFDPDGDALSYSWDFGGSQSSGAAVTHTFTAAGSYVVTLTVADGRGGSHSASVTVSVSAPPAPSSLIVNGDFANGLTGWTTWKERGSLSPTVSSGQLRMAATGHNGGVYQTFSTGGAGGEIHISGFWASNPTVRQAQWAEVLIINGTREPVEGQDLSATAPDVVLVYKNDTWASPSGWSGPMSATAPVESRGAFTAAGSVATIVLKSGNLLGVSSGTTFDDVVVESSGGAPAPNRPPVAKATASPTSGAAPLTVSFDASGSTDPDGDALTYSWSFGDGTAGSGVSPTHVYSSPGSFTASLTAQDGRGGSHATSVAISVTAPPAPPPPVMEWDSRLSTLGLQVIEPSIPPGTWYWKLVSGRFESDGEILPPPGGGSESGGTHSIYVRAQNPDGSLLENQRAIVFWPASSPTNEAAIVTKGAVDGFWGNFPMAGGWCPFFPEGPRGPYGVRIADSASDAVWGMGMPCNRHVNYRFVWKWSRKDSGQSKLSIHTGFGGPKSMQFIQKAKPRIVKILDSFSGAAEVKRLSPSTRIIGRAFLSQQPMDGDAVERAREWWERSKSLILQYPEIDYWEGYNEPIIQTPELMLWYAAFEAERVRLLAANGRKACIGNFSVGNPDIPLWPHFFAAIDAARANGGILGLHEYGTPMQQHFDEVSGEGWFTGRYRKVYRQFLVPEGKVLPLAVTETGVDVVPPVGWKNHFTDEEYLDQLKWYDRVLLEDDYVLGATIFALEIPGWFSFDIAPIVDRLADYVMPK